MTPSARSELRVSLTPSAFPPDFLTDFNISSLSGLLSPALTESLLVALPPCHLTGGNATLTVRRANDSKGRLPGTCLVFPVNPFSLALLDIRPCLSRLFSLSGEVSVCGASMPWAQGASERGGQWGWLHRHAAQRISSDKPNPRN